LSGPECNCWPPLAATAVSCRCEVPHPWRATLAHPLTRSQSDVVGKGSQGKRGRPALVDTGASTVTCRPHAGEAGAAEQANKRVGMLPMRNGSRQGKAQPCESANACIYNICHTAPADERPPFPETVCGIVLRATRWLKGGENLRASREAKRPCNSVFMQVQILPPRRRGESVTPSLATGPQRAEAGVNGGIGQPQS
jgi:hypothetical protein